ncbi:hypothetical protein ATERTT37_007044 [Aspergillus terreus]
MKPSVEAQQDELSKASKVVNSTTSAIDAVKCLNGQAIEAQNFASKTERAASQYLRHARLNAFQISVVRLMMFGMFVQGFWYGSALARSRQLSSGEVLRTFWACLSAAQSIELVLPQVILLEKGKLAASSLSNILTLDPENKATGEMKGVAYPRYCEGDIEVSNLSFAYASQPDKLRLDNVNFFFPAGETTFVIGRSGSGKSTLGQLLARFYLPTSGQILIDGNPIQTLNINWIRNNITVVEQRSVLFNESILVNIAFGRRDYKQIRNEDVNDCVELAMLHSIIDNMPNGINTCVGHGGNFLSGGQRQRVAIARARLRDTPILILDEPTSALDSANRVKVMKAIREWRKGKTTIIITHDMSQILEHDFVYIMEQGSVFHAGYWHEVKTRPGTEKYFSHEKHTTSKSASGGGHSKLDVAEKDGWISSDASSTSSTESLDDGAVGKETLSNAPSTQADNYRANHVRLLQTFYDTHSNAMKWALVVLAVSIGDGIVSYFMHYYLELVGQAWVDFLRKQAFRRVLDQPKKWFEEEENAPSQITACLGQDAEEMRNIVGRFGGFVLLAVAISVLALMWSLAVCWKLTLIALACGPVIYAITRGFEGTTGLWERRCNEAGAVAGEIFIETFAEIRTVRTLTLEPFFHKKYLKAAAACTAAGLRKALYTGFLFGLVESMVMFISVSSEEYKVQDITTVFSMLLFSIGYASIVLSWNERSPLSSSYNVRAAAQSAGIDEFISSLPQGYRTVIGDGGVGLSGGQAQRVVIARALVRRPQILILDEATSALDPASADVIRGTVQRLVASQLGLTVIIITHAREMMQIADNVVVLEQGCVKETGSYSLLCKQTGGRLKTLAEEEENTPSD